MRLHDIRKTYGDKVVFDRFELDIPDGSVTWIMGESGAGKTTLLRIIAGLEDFNGEMIGREGRISMVFQEDRLFEELSPVDNCLITASGAAAEDIRRELLLSGIPEENLKLPANKLSGGMKRRTAVIRALFYPSDILLMDEPFKGLDDDSRRKTAEIVSRMAGGRTVIAVTHDIADTELLKGNVVNISACR